eukprot:10432931-Heterocapsa_arctica.AAC.1
MAVVGEKDFGIEVNRHETLRQSEEAEAVVDKAEKAKLILEQEQWEDSRRFNFLKDGKQAEMTARRRQRQEQ